MKPFKELKYAYQRITRGYSDRDLWSFDHYLAIMIPLALNQLKKQKHGIPTECFSDPYKPNQTKEDEAEAIEKWDYILTTMIEGFEAHANILDNCPHEEEFKQLEAQRILGMNFFVQHFGSLWD